MGENQSKCKNNLGYYIKLDGDTGPARAVDVVMARAKRIYLLIIKFNKLFSFFSSPSFLKEIENMYSVFLSSYRNALVKVWGNSKKLWKHSPAARVPTAFLVLPNFHSCLYNSIETRYMFSISQIKNGGRLRHFSSVHKCLGLSFFICFMI